jgi:hypothetical protein
MENNADTPQYWFRARRYGWGWTPCSVEGWIVTIFTALALVAGNLAIALLAGEVARHSAVEWRPSESDYLGIVLAWNVLVLGPAIWISWKRGEPPRWRWGGRDPGR